MSELTPKEMAHAGLWILRQAILKLLSDGVPKQPSEVRDALGLKWDESEPPGIALAVMTLMADSGELVKGDGVRPSYSVPVSTH
ncbi:MAG: hypothetical protein K8T89_23065 [Planctomycetes bacterium]|nr:hypothetical protein [Planctomycetota bacterium]